MTTNIFSIFMFAIPGGPQTRATVKLFYDLVRLAFIRFGIDIKSMFVVFVAGRFCFLEGWTDFGFHFISRAVRKAFLKKV